jgi:hypothetical protein
MSEKNIISCLGLESFMEDLFSISQKSKEISNSVASSFNES